MNTAQNHDRPNGRRRKAVLTCQACGHRSPVRGDWTWLPAGDDVAVTCPDCGHELARRPASEAPPEPRCRC